MLVLSRKKDESIVLDGHIEIRVLKIKGNTVRLGIKAPAAVKVLRGELSPFAVDDEIQKCDPHQPANSSNSRIEMVIQDVTVPSTFAVVGAP